VFPVRYELSLHILFRKIPVFKGLTPGERARCTHWVGGGVDPRAGLDDVEKRKFFTLPGLELRPHCRS
jgi:hypothetical protein